MAISVTLPVETVSGLNASIEAGGSLDPNTTYYYIVVGFANTHGNNYNTAAVGRMPFASPISAEDSFTTTTSGLSAHITWANSPGADYYQIFVTTTSGVYNNSGGYGTGLETVGNITDGPTGYTVTALSTETYVHHSIQLVNTLYGGIPNETGIIRVELSGSDTHDIEDIYDAIVAAGYSDYVSYDGWTFVLKGWISSFNNSSATTLNVTRKNLVFIKGGIGVSTSPNVVFQFGTWDSDLLGANYYNACNIDIQSSRPCIWGTWFGNIKMYACKVTVADSIVFTQSENLYYIYFHGGAGVTLTYYVDEIKECITGMLWRGNTTDIYDAKYGQSNNFSNVDHVRCEIYELANLPYSAGLGHFYQCKFTDSEAFAYYDFNDGNGDWCDFYDCEFPVYSNTPIPYTIDAPWFQISHLNAGYLYSKNYVEVYYSLKATVLDDTGTGINDVTVNVKDKNGNNITWVEHDGTNDRLTTGTTYTNDVTTDANGQIDYYIHSYKTEHNPDNTDYPTSTDVIQTVDFPFTVTFSATGYEPYTIILNTLLERTELVVALETSPEQQVEFLPLPSGYTGELTGPLSPEGGIIGDDPLGGGVQMNIGMDEGLLRDAIHAAYMGKTITVPFTEQNGQTVTNIYDPGDPRCQTTLSAVLDSVSEANDKQLAAAIAEEVITHIKDYAATVGATDEILFINGELQSTVDEVMGGFTDIAGVVSAIPGGGAISAKIAARNLSLTEIVTNLSAKSDLNMSNNIE